MEVHLSAISSGVDIPEVLRYHLSQQMSSQQGSQKLLQGLQCLMNLQPTFLFLTSSDIASELESDLWDTVDWGKKWLTDFNAGKTQLVLFDWSNNTGSIDVKMDGYVLEEK